MWLGFLVLFILIDPLFYCTFARPRETILTIDRYKPIHRVLGIIFFS